MSWISRGALFKGINLDRILLKNVARSVSSAKKTCLHDFHVSQGGKMVDFAGYSLPIQYGNEGISCSHLHTRKHCSIFDVSHMLQTNVYGKHAVEFMESLTVADLQNLKENQGALTLFTNDQGGIIDDLIVSKIDNNFLYVVSNAGCRHKDIPLMKLAVENMKRQGKDVGLAFLDDRGLIAIQGPEAAQVVQSVTKSPIKELAFMTTQQATIAGVEDCRLTRCGYTGEDGFEISIPESKTGSVTEALLESKAGKARLAGLGARDSLRLEAGLCLYGNDIDETTTPIEAGLVWTIGKRRLSSRDFPGADKISRKLKDKKSLKRVGLITTSGPPPRPNSAKIADLDGKFRITSGCPSPTLGVNLAMAYVPGQMGKVGTTVHLVVRNKNVEATVAKMPFVEAKYYTKKA